MKDLGVLVVHYDEEVLSVIKRMFSHFEITVDCAGSTIAALERLNTKEYRALIIDMNMPGMLNGIELSRKAREQFPKLQVIIFSGNSTEQIMQLILDPKVSDILTEEYLKPCSLNEMMQGFMNKKTGKTFLLE